MKSSSLPIALMVAHGLCSVINAFSLRSEATLEQFKISENIERREVLNGGEYNRLETVISGNNRSYGNMFDIQAKNEVFIRGLEFYCGSRLNITYEVFTKAGSYSGYEQSPGNWTMISNGTVLTLGPNVTTPTYDFEEYIWLSPGSIQSFYVTLLQPEIRYTEAETEGSLVVEDKNLEIFSGVDVAGYPFGPLFYRSRIFNGAILYTSSTPSDQTLMSSIPSESSSYPSSTPSSTPTNHLSTSPSISLSSEIGYIIPLSYLLEHDLSDKLSEIPKVIDAKVTEVLEEIFLDNKRIKVFVDEYKLELISVRSFLVDMSSDKSRACLVSDTSRICSIVDIMVEVYHEESISQEIIRHAVLSYSKDIENQLEFPKVTYVGFNAVETELSLSLSGTELTAFDKDTVALFEETLFTFSNNKLSDITISSVAVKSQRLNSSTSKSAYQTSAEVGAKPKKRDQMSFLAESLEKVSMLDIVVEITGEYLPPPKLDFGLKVAESLSAQGDRNEFLTYLKTYPAFDKITNVQPQLSLSVDARDAESDYLGNKLTLGEGGLRTKWFYTLCGGAAFILFLLAVVFGFMYLKNHGKGSSLPTGSLNYNVERFISFRRGSSVSKVGMRRGSSKSKVSMRRGSSKSKVSIRRDSGETVKNDCSSQSDEESIRDERPIDARRDSSTSLLWGS